MSTLIVKIKKTTISTVKVSIPQNLNLFNDSIIEPELDLAAILDKSGFSRKMVNFEYKVFNSIDEIKKKIESSKEHNKPFSLNRLAGRLEIVNEHRSTDLDDWHETSVRLNLFEFSKKGNAKSNLSIDTFDLYKYLEGKEDKYLVLKISQK